MAVKLLMKMKKINITDEVKACIKFFDAHYVMGMIDIKYKKRIKDILSIYKATGNLSYRQYKFLAKTKYIVENGIMG